MYDKIGDANLSVTADGVLEGCNRLKTAVKTWPAENETAQ
jgi:hypothetical protein